MSEKAITIKNLTISYRCLKAFSLRKTFFQFKKQSKIEYFTAVKDVSFEVEKGKILGIVGKKGSGKSTMLKAIAGIFSEDSGSIDLHGNSVSLLSVGVGFQKRLSGYDNIFLSGMLLGFSEKEIKEKIDDIIDFSELRDFIYKPVNSYSSGMYSKLAFSITAFLETDILLIDEVFSVGDANFKKKSYNKMKELISNTDRTVIIVSHNDNALKDLCSEILWLHNGKVKMQGDPETVLSAYEDFMK